jgi:hypothetical protein
MRSFNAYQFEQEVRPYVSTAEAAFLLGRQPQTLHKWASQENGPIRPIRIHSRLAWAVADIKRLLKGGE